MTTKEQLEINVRRSMLLDVLASEDERYQAVEGSQSYHCCFEATVVDTTRPHMLNGKHYEDGNGRKYYYPVCECFDLADAQMIAAALNLSMGLAGAALKFSGYSGSTEGFSGE